MPPGRPLAGVWYYYTRSIDQLIRAEYVKATCRGCGAVLSGLVSRMWKHAETCQGLIDAGLSGSQATPPQHRSKRPRQQLLSNYSLGDATAAWLDVLERFPGMFCLSCTALWVPMHLRRQVSTSTQSGPRPFQICDGRSSFFGSLPFVLPVHLSLH